MDIRPTRAEGDALVESDGRLLMLFSDVLAGLPDGCEPITEDFGMKTMVLTGGKRVPGAYFKHGGRRYRITLDAVTRVRTR